MDDDYNTPTMPATQTQAPVQKQVQTETQAGNARDAEPTAPRVQRKKARRGKYIARACDFCQRRKIKCTGETPCASCAAKRRDCIKQPRQGTPIVDRLALVERQLESLAQAKPQSSQPNPPAVRVPESDSSSSNPRPSVVYSGETSLTHTLSQAEDQLGAAGVAFPDHVPPGDVGFQSPRRATLPSPGPDTNPSGLLRRALLHNEIALDRTRWDQRLQSFFDEVYVLYPMLHIPDTRAVYERIWDDWFLLPTDQGPNVDLHYRLQVAQILLCLAAGTTTVSRRASIQDGRHAAGWSLYCAAMDLVGDLFALIECDSPMEVLQTLLLIVVYLLPLDAVERGQKVLSLAVSYAHQVGIHRQRVLNRMYHFDDEMFRRIWWCIYIMDRRYAVETGRPFLTQDFNIDCAMPRNCSDEWMSLHHKTHRTSAELSESLDAHLLDDHWTPVPYLCAMARYCKILGKVWEMMYGATHSEMLPGGFQIEFLETLLSKFEAELPPVYQNNTSYLEHGVLWRHLKQRALMRMRIPALRLLIRQPLLKKSPSGSTEDQSYIANEIMCLQLAHEIINKHAQIPDEHPKFVYPFIPYLANATTISLIILIKEPLFRPTYASATILAARTLRIYCTKTWVSGKLIRSILRLHQMVVTVLGDDTPALSNGHSTPTNRNASHNSASTYHSALDSMSNELQDGQSSPLAIQNPSANYLSAHHDASLTGREKNVHMGSSIGERNANKTLQATSHISPDLSNVVMTNFDFEEEMLSYLCNGIGNDGSDPYKSFGVDDRLLTDDWSNAFLGGF